jgi:hypothetical protein
MEESVKRRARISSVSSRVNGRVIGKPAVESREIHFIRDSSSAMESIYYNSYVVERETRLESRYIRVEREIGNA